MEMLLHFWKCKCLHTRHRNLNIKYNMGDTVLGTTVKEKDLGITISADMNSVGLQLQRVIKFIG